MVTSHTVHTAPPSQLLSCSHEGVRSIGRTCSSIKEKRFSTANGHLAISQNADEPGEHRHCLDISSLPVPSQPFLGTLASSCMSAALLGSELHPVDLDDLAPTLHNVGCAGAGQQAPPFLVLHPFVADPTDLSPNPWRWGSKERMHYAAAPANKE